MLFDKIIPEISLNFGQSVNFSIFGDFGWRNEWIYVLASSYKFSIGSKFSSDSSWAIAALFKTYSADSDSIKFLGSILVEAGSSFNSSLAYFSLFDFWVSKGRGLSGNKAIVADRSLFFILPPFFKFSIITSPNSIFQSKSNKTFKKFRNNFHRI